MGDILIMIVVFYVGRVVLRALWGGSRHLTTDETAEKGKTTTKALVIVLEVWMSTYVWTM